MEQAEQKITIARRTIEERYGTIGSGGKMLFIGGVPMGLKKIARKLALLYEDLIPIDAGTMAGGAAPAHPSARGTLPSVAAKHWIRFYEGEQRKVIVIEFDGEYNIVGENGADIMDWIGDEYFRIHWRIFCPAGGEEWLGGDATKGRSG